MATIVFSGGAELLCTGTDANGMMRNLARTADGDRASERGVPLPSGFLDVHTEDGIRYINPTHASRLPGSAGATRPRAHSAGRSPADLRVRHL